jgi:hypothetical protein
MRRPATGLQGRPIQGGGAPTVAARFAVWVRQSGRCVATGGSIPYGRSGAPRFALLGAQLARREILREWTLGWRATVLVVPRGVRNPVATLVLIGPTEREEHKQVRATVHDLTPDIGSDSADLADPEVALLTLCHDGESTVKHEEHFLLMEVAVDPSSLSGPQPDDVQPEGGDAQLASKRLEALARFEIES